MSSHAPHFLTLYACLGIHLSATRSKIRKAYKDLAVRSHPDKVPLAQRVDATVEFQKLHDAYEYCLGKVGTHCQRPSVEDAEEVEEEGGGEGEEDFWCSRDDVPAEYAVMAGGISAWKEGDGEAPTAWLNWVKACAKAKRNERVKKTRFERLWLETEYKDAYEAFEAWMQKAEDSARDEWRS
jgi:hypothetical protein